MRVVRFVEAFLGYAAVVQFLCLMFKSNATRKIDLPARPTCDLISPTPVKSFRTRARESESNQVWFPHRWLAIGETRRPGGALSWAIAAGQRLDRAPSYHRRHASEHRGAGP
jgi:hypothetical protein